MKHLVNHRLAVALGIIKPSPRRVSDELLRAGINRKSLQHMFREHRTALDTVSSPSTYIKDDSMSLDEAKADERCVRRCTLVNVVDSANCSSSTSVDELVKHINTFLETKIGEKRVGDSEEETAGSEWMLMARVVDRMCFIVFSVGYVAGTLAMSLMATLGG